MKPHSIAMVIGEVAIVGVPGELFTGLGVDLKERSPFEHTYVVSLANDWMGYLPDREAHDIRRLSNLDGTAQLRGGRHR